MNSAFPTARRRPSAAIAVAAAALLLAGCSGGRQAVGDALGLTVESPNAFNVVPRAPLRLPSDLSALPPPQPGASSPLDPQPEQSARAALAQAGAPAAGGGAAPTSGEMALLDSAGAAQADPGIRQTLAAESPEYDREYGLTSLFGYKVPDGSEQEILANREEADRIRAAGGVTPNPTPEAPEEPSNEIAIPLGDNSLSGGPSGSSPVGPPPQ